MSGDEKFGDTFVRFDAVYECARRQKDKRTEWS